MKVEIRHTIPRFIEAMRRAPSVVMEEVDRTVGRVAIEGAREAKREAPKAFSELVNSIRNEQIGLAFHRIIAEAAHARAVEEGAEPGRRPPVEEIRRWMNVVGVAANAGNEVRDRIAFMISRSIEREGTPAQPYMAPARETSIARLQSLLPGALARGTERALS